MGAYGPDASCSPQDSTFFIINSKGYPDDREEGKTAASETPMGGSYSLGASCTGSAHEVVHVHRIQCNVGTLSRYGSLRAATLGTRGMGDPVETPLLRRSFRAQPHFSVARRAQLPAKAGGGEIMRRMKRSRRRYMELRKNNCGDPGRTVCPVQGSLETPIFLELSKGLFKLSSEMPSRSARTTPAASR